MLQGWRLYGRGGNDGDRNVVEVMLAVAMVATIVAVVRSPMMMVWQRRQ